MKRLLLIFLFVTKVASAQSLYSPPFLQVPAWVETTTPTRYPSNGTFDISTFHYIGGVIGLNPNGAVSHGVVTFYWTMDSSGENIVGVQGVSLSSLIVSMDQLRLPNLGPFLYITYQPLVGPNGLSATLFATDTSETLPGDTILVDEANQQLAPYTAVAFYSADYFAGEGRLYLDAPAGVRVTVYGMDLTGQFWPLDSTGPGSLTTVLPMGVWLVVISNPTSETVQYTVAVTPLVRGWYDHR